MPILTASNYILQISRIGPMYCVIGGPPPVGYPGRRKWAMAPSKSVAKRVPWGTPLLRTNNIQVSDF